MCRHHSLPNDAEQMLSLLGKEAMSSEESVGDIGDRTRAFRIKRLPWRNQALTKWLHELDVAPLKNPAGNLLGHRIYRRTRDTSGDLISARTPPCHIPSVVVDRNWLLGQKKAVKNALQLTNQIVTLPQLPWIGPKVGTPTLKRTV